MRPINWLAGVLSTFDRDVLKFLHRKGTDKLQVGGQMEWWTPDRFGGRKRVQTFRNTRTIVGANAALETVFRSGGQTATWYIGLVDNTAFSGFSVNDTMASHAGWTEFTSYSGGNRATWGPAAAAAGSITNTTNFTFAITGNGTLAGGFVSSVQAVSPGNTGILWATALQNRSVTIGSTLNGNYTYTLTPGS
jgi:hypothetical protein